jgi:VanZ family protein
MTPTPALRRTAWTLTALYAAFHFVMTHLPQGDLPRLPGTDKLYHFLSYGVISGCLYLALWIGGFSIKRAGLMVLFAVASFGVFDEILQAPIGRDPELLDWIADVSAAIVAVTCFSILRAILARRASGPKDDGRSLAVSQDV